MSKNYSSYKSQRKSFQICPEFFPSYGPPKTAFNLGLFEILSYRFLTIFPENFKFTIVAYGQIKKPQLSGKMSDRRAKRSERDSWVV